MKERTCELSRLHRGVKSRARTDPARKAKKRGRGRLRCWRQRERKTLLADRGEVFEMVGVSEFVRGCGCESLVVEGVARLAFYTVLSSSAGFPS